MSTSTTNINQQDTKISPRDVEARVNNAHTTKIIAEKTTRNKNRSKVELIGEKQRNESYKKIINQTQKELPASNRLLSKLAHNKLIEKFGDIIGCTIARPNAMLAGSIVSFALTLLTYITAKKIGYALSGFETIAAFITGWIIGIIYDYLRILITGKKD